MKNVVNIFLIIFKKNPLASDLFSYRFVILTLLSLSFGVQDKMKCERERKRLELILFFHIINS